MEADEKRSTVTALEDTAPVLIDTSDGYVRIEQMLGNHPLYTPEEARDLAEDILAAAEEADPQS
jgi:uncharacterized membrane protein YgcG